LPIFSILVLVVSSLELGSVCLSDSGNRDFFWTLPKERVGLSFFQLFDSPIGCMEKFNTEIDFIERIIVIAFQTENKI
jgi:hypothetical protein